jgi:Carboxypeptidase regulatory-like domain
MRRGLLLGACVVLAVAAQSTQGLSSISITVVSAESGRPVKGANVIAIAETASGLTTSTGVTTDRQGRAVILGLSKSRVRLSVRHSSFVSMVYGQSAPNDSNGTFIAVGENQQIENITLRVTRGGVISGSIVDEAGEPLVGVQVRAYRRVFTNGRQTFVVWTGLGDSPYTDDRGMYRIAFLPPGDYLVGIAGRYLEYDVPEPDAAADEIPAAGFLPATGRMLFPQAGSPEPIGEAGTPALAYPVTFFPGTTVSAAAAMIRLGAGERRDGVSFALQPVPVTRVSGRVIDPTGAPTRIALRLLPAVPDDRVGVEDMSTTFVGSNGRFGFSMVPPGQYVLEARGNATPDSSQMLLAHPMWASTPVTVVDKPIGDITLTLEEGQSFGGQIRIDGERPPGFPRLTNLRVVLELPSTVLDQPAVILSLTSGVDEQGRFRVSQVIPGEYRMTVVGLPSGWRLTSAMVDGRDALDFGLRISPHHDIDAAILTVSNKLSELSGIVRDAMGAPTTRGYAVIFPSDSQYWMSSSWRIQGTRPDTDGQFRFRQLPPGNYLLAVADCEPGQFRDPAFLQTLKSRATPVVIGNAETVTKDIRW